MSRAAAIFGLSGTSVTEDERAFFEDARPWGFILFKRNCASRDQVRRLADDLREIDGRANAPILIDQEGGRVQRLIPPEWPKHPPMAPFGKLYRRDEERALEALGLNTMALASELLEVGVNVDCIPCLDVPVPGSHSIIGDRAFTDDPVTVARLGRLVAETLMSAGVLPVIKHMPGHGRANLDTHEALPAVATAHAELSRTDFVPFKALSDMPLGMSAHVVFEKLDPDRPATLSQKVVQGIIREEIGFGGLLLTDDLNMKALSGGVAERALAAIKAGCDIALHCNGNLAEMEAIADVVPQLDGKPLARVQRAEKLLRGPAAPSMDIAEAAIYALF